MTFDNGSGSQITYGGDSLDFGHDFSAATDTPAGSIPEDPYMIGICALYPNLYGLHMRCICSLYARYTLAIYLVGI